MPIHNRWVHDTWVSQCKIGQRVKMEILYCYLRNTDQKIYNFVVFRRSASETEVAFFDFTNCIWFSVVVSKHVTICSLELENQHYEYIELIFPSLALIFKRVTHSQKYAGSPYCLPQPIGLCLYYQVQYFLSPLSFVCYEKYEAVYNSFRKDL